MARRECHPLDGVPVKIASEVRPPKTVTLPGNLFKSMLPPSLDFEYDFALEHRVLAEAQQERERLAKLEALRPVAATTPAITNSAKVASSTGEVLTPLIPSSNSSPDETTSPPTATANISLTEFESEAFSPFDQVELQTLNDFEELNSIFGKLRTSNSAPPTPVNEEPPSVGSSASSSQSGVMPAATTTLNTAGVGPTPMNCGDLSAVNSAVAGALNTGTASSPNPVLVPGSMKNLFDEEQLARVSKGYHYRPAPPPPTVKQQPPRAPPVADPIKDLPVHLQALAKQFAMMGFPVDRVARAVMDLGNDEPKVVEHLCLIQTLTEEGFDERDAAQALQFNGSDLEKAKAFLVSWRQLSDLGFDRKDIALALKLHNNDRDKVLDELLSKS